MTAPLVSIITPTFGRTELLPSIAKCVFEQSFSDFEWLVLDDGPTPSKFMQELSDSRVRYRHSGKKAAIGGKRNRLVQEARGSIIAQFDDDDFYGPNYLAKMLTEMDQNNVDIVKFFGFFLYNRMFKTFGYWDLMTKVGPHWIFSAVPPSLMILTEQNNQKLKDTHLGFGFSFVFKRKVWEHIKFEEINHNEDAPFISSALQRFKLVGVHDYRCTCIHVIHETSTSSCFPQYMIPSFLVAQLFPAAREFLDRLGALSPLTV